MVEVKVWFVYSINICISIVGIVDCILVLYCKYNLIFDNRFIN